MSAVSIELRGGFIALVDEEDADLVRRYRWHAKRKSDWTQNRYVARSANVGGKTRCVYLHREIIGAQPGQFVDHINGNTLDNRRSNLRLCTQAQNIRNRAADKDNASGFKGISRTGGKRSPWRADIVADAIREYLGVFATPEEAARAYDAAALRLHGEFARLNFPTTSEQ